jgi:predicted AlkP superfamily pyrophosphatase or phosphodiesterase
VHCTAVAAVRPNLVVLVIIDQLRGDMPWRFKDRFGPDGFRYLLDNGVAYTNAHFRHSTTLTAVGHATLVTGGHAAQHGMAGNRWYNRETGQPVYCVEDDRHGIIGTKQRAHTGTSPRNLTSSTIGDEIFLASNGRSRIFSVSIKDRGAIVSAGLLGKAFWYSSRSGRFVTSTYYYDDYPQWVNDWNAAEHAESYRDREWTLLRDRSSYLYGDADDRPFERPDKTLGRTFPHPLGNPKSGRFFSVLRSTPMGDELTLDFVKHLVENEELGRGPATDMLAVSFSATDYIGHAFGPGSLEAEDNLLRLDRTLASLIRFIDQTVGLGRTLLVLSSDHGVGEIPEYKASLGIASGRGDLGAFIGAVNSALQARFGSSENFVADFSSPSIYLNLETIGKLELDVATLERALAEETMQLPGFALAVTRTDLLSGNVADNPLINRLQRAFHPKRSGNVLIALDPFRFLQFGPSTTAATHGSPYAYDTHVPIMIVGPGIGHQIVHRPVGPEDIAPTIATYLAIKPPSGSTGKALLEVLNVYDAVE